VEVEPLAIADHVLDSIEVHPVEVAQADSRAGFCLLDVGHPDSPLDPEQPDAL
jgi:hypothetical protein